MKSSCPSPSQPIGISPRAVTRRAAAAAPVRTEPRVPGDVHLLTRVLLVDEQPDLRDGITQLLPDGAAAWTLDYAAGSGDALTLLSRTPFDIVVADTSLPGMDGVKLMHDVMRRRPSTLRILLSNQQLQVLRSVGPAHQFLPKPCPPGQLIETIERACALRELIRDPQLEAVVSRVTKLPSVPRIYMQLEELLRDPDVSLKAVGELIAHDLAISANVLRLVNSGYFGLRQRVDSPVHAAILLGIERLRPLVLSAGIVSRFEGTLPPGLSLDGLMQQSLATSAAAQSLLASELPYEGDQMRDAALAGILRDIGYLILLQNRCPDYELLLEAARHGARPWAGQEPPPFQMSHARLGAYLAGLWGFSDRVVEAVAYHHGPSSSPEQRFGVLTAVHVADALVQEIAPAEAWPFGAALDTAYLCDLGLSDRLDGWREEIRGSIRPA